MLNGKYKKSAMKELEHQVYEYDKNHKMVISNAEGLHKIRNQSIDHIERIELFANSLANKPIDFERKFTEIDVIKKSFENEISEVQRKNKSVEVKAGVQVGAGIATGVGVAATAPTAALAIATTFGTASTGTAIASLSGAAATNAAMAWLGGGALAAGGGGIVGGTAFLALAGPLGMAIGGVSAAGAGVMASKKNKKIAEEADRESKKIMNESSELKKINSSIVSLKNQTKDFLDKNIKMFSEINGIFPSDYLKCDEEQKQLLGAMVNNTYSMSKLIVKRIEG